MIHADTHDPTLDWQRCLVCHQALAAAFSTVANMTLGPNEAGKLIKIIRREAERHMAHGAAS